jgi:hypothetical protein
MNEWKCLWVIMDGRKNIEEHERRVSEIAKKKQQQQRREEEE